MNSYNFSLKNYHAIENADLTIDGITMIAGENGSGKSTILKWLYAFIYMANQFDHKIDINLAAHLNERWRNNIRVINNFLPADEHIRYQPVISSSMINGDETSYRDIKHTFLERTLRLSHKIADIHLENHSNDINWIKRELRIPDELIDHIPDSYFRTSQDFVKNEIEKAEKAKFDRKLDLLFLFIKSEFQLYSGDNPKEMQFSENGLPLILTSVFRQPINLRKVIYVETPMELSNNAYDNEIWSKLAEILAEDDAAILPQKNKDIIAYIQKIIGGNVILKEDELGYNAELRYVRKEDNLNIPLEQAATGLKSFALILRLLQNGFLDENTLLIYDEPEAHLHPKWIVDFASVLAKLNKELGVKILLASHNPDMIGALKAISSKHNIESSTRFYQAVENKETRRYSYLPLGNDTEKIFESFNEALEKISEFEDSSL